ncbi:MAG: DUF1549 domain-containing protein [Planctomycetota bacterium]|nr:DUF1549 domain-containing protein [Planctomycetota bacterium]
MCATRLAMVATQVMTLSFLLSAPVAVYAEEPLLERDVLPILTKHCMGCHGGLRQQAGLDLRTLPGMLAGGDSGTVIEPGHAEKSELWKRIASDEMPAGDDREKLSAEDKAIIKAWIDAELPTVSERQQNVDPLLPVDKRHTPREVAAAIDQHIDCFLAAAELTPVSRSDDVEFVRRVYLDLSGRVPTARQAAEFLDSRDSDKREKLIDALLATPAFGDQLGRTWRDWVCPPELPSTGNAGDQPHQQAREFGKWLGAKLTADEPWDKITREILTVQGEITDQPQLIFFGLVGTDAKTTADGSARAVASLFMGVQLQCARCHDDPYRDWSQQEHWALTAFFGRAEGDFNKIEVGKGPSAKPGEIAIPGSAFKNAGVTVPAAFLRGGTFESRDVDDLRGPFVDWLVAKDNPYFARALANRLWFYLFSRGIVNPIDDFRELNPPSHPGLMKLLAGEFVACGYDVKHLFRCICNSQAYQRTSWVDPETDDQVRGALTMAFGRMPLRLMTADMLYDSLRLAYGASILDLRTSVEHVTVGMSSAVADPYLEFQRRFGTNEEDATDFTHGVAQMLTMINHPRLMAGSNALDAIYFPDSLRLPPVDPGRNEDLFRAVKARFVRFTIEQAEGQPCLDELEVYAPGSDTNLALASSGSQASASSLLPGYDIHQIPHLNDGKHGNAHSWISNEVGGGWAQIKLPTAAEVNRVVWGRDRGGEYKDRLAQQYHIEASLDGEAWTRVSDSARRVAGPSDDEPDLSKVVLTTAQQTEAIEWLYLNTLSRRPTEEEATEAMNYVEETPDKRAALTGVLWTLVNRSEYIFVR